MLARGGTAPAILNGANEIAVDAFLHDRIRFGGIAQLVEETLTRADIVSTPTLDDVFAADAQARRIALELLETPAFRI